MLRRKVGPIVALVLQQVLRIRAPNRVPVDQVDRKGLALHKHDKQHDGERPHVRFNAIDRGRVGGYGGALRRQAQQVERHVLLGAEFAMLPKLFS